MYKIEELHSLVEKIDAENKNILPAELIDFSQFVKKIEAEFKKINSDYVIELEPYVNSGREPFIICKLEHNYKQIFNYSTALSFYKYKEGDLFHTAEYHALDGSIDFTLDKEVSFKKDPVLFKEILEDKLINAFLDNEKIIRANQEAKNSLRVKTI